MDSSDRSFTVIAMVKSGKKLGVSGGRYISKNPYSAAKKAFSQYYREHPVSGRFSLEVHLKETTQNSSHKIFKYRITKVNEPKVVIRDGQTIQYKYTVKIRSNF